MSPEEIKPAAGTAQLFERQDLMDHKAFEAVAPAG